ncbi:MAG: cysteine synthase A [Oscillospiraceae bacterium]|jgi:cysteine synthase A|nr:cysteine synthase A [Oscillospiraceae bacterium]
MPISPNILATIGHTPLVALNRLRARMAFPGEVLVKIEARNPGGSIKDRAALSMLDAAERSGALLPGGTIIEPTSGNTGVGLAMIAAVRGYKVILTMPETMSIERRRLLAAFGAQLVLTEGAKGMAGAIEKANALMAEIPGSFMPTQFENPDNAAAHFASTGPEIWQDTEGRIDAFVAGVGTGGTLTGVGSFLKKQNPGIQLIAVEPADSPVLSQGRAGAHTLQGIGAGFIPKALDVRLIDEIFPVSGADAMAMGRALAAEEGILAGITSGAAAFAACSLAARPEYAEKRIVALLPDTGERYLSTAMFAE